MSTQPNPAFNIKATDWEIATINQIGGAAVVGAGLWLVKFRSRLAGVDEPFNFSGGLFGAGGSIGGISFSPSSFRTGQLSYSPIACLRSFSIYDLDGTFARVTDAGASAVVGYSLMYVSAYDMSGSLFYSQPCHGFGVGSVGIIGVTGIGVWTHM